jgi:hypothetical protein
MAKFTHDDVLDASPNYIKSNCTRMTACSAQPTTYAEGNATYALADVTMASGDFTIANGDTSGRKLVVAAKTGVAVDSAGTATHVALLDVANSKLLSVTTCTSQGLSSGGTVDFSTWDDEYRDPT